MHPYITVKTRIIVVEPKLVQVRPERFSARVTRQNKGLHPAPAIILLALLAREADHYTWLRVGAVSFQQDA